MKSDRFRVLLRKHRWSLGAMVLVLVYTLAGFLLLPWLLERYLTHTLAAQWQRPVNVADVRFNPFQVRLQVDGLQVLDTDNTQLFSLEQLRFDYEVLSIFRLEYGVEEFALVRPFVKLVADGEGSYTLLHLFASDAKDKPVTQDAPAESSGSMPAAALKKLAVLDGVVDYQDPRRAGGFRQVINLPNLQVEDFHTRPGEFANHVSLLIRDEDAGELDISTTVQLQPLQLKGNLSLKNLNLGRMWQWLMLPVNFHLLPPRLDLATQFDLQMLDQLDLQLSGASLALRDLAISSKTTPDTPAIRLPLLEVNDVQVSLLQQQVEIGSVQTSDGWIDIAMDKQGVNNLQALFAPVENPASSPAANPPAEPVLLAPEPMPATDQAQQAAAVVPPAANPPAVPSQPWDVLIHQLAINNYTVQFHDEKPSEPFVVILSPLSIAINEWKPLAPEPFALQLKTGISAPAIEPAAQLAVDARVQASPLQVNAHVDLQQLPLQLTQAYIHDIARVDINNGLANAALDIEVASADVLQLKVMGGVKVQQLDVHERGTERKLLSWDALDVAGLSYQLQENSLAIEQITLGKLNSGFVINDDGTTNVQELLLPQPPSAAENATQPMQILIGTIAIQDADLGFADLSMKPNFRVAMQQLSGSINGLSSDPKALAVIDLKGKVDRYAPVTIKGKLNPLAEKPNLDVRMAFSNLELTTFTPYSGTYAGFKIDKGQLSLDIDYKLVNNRIQGKNRIVMNQLQLGQPVNSNKAVDLPLRLAIALLRDEQGVIDLGFEVSGDLNDPKFSIGGIIWKVLSNMIMKVVTSPFNALSALAGGADTEGMDQIVFAAGQDQPDQLSLGRLQTAAGMLKKRSSLQLNVQGNVLPEQDRPALQKQKLLAILRENNEVPAEAFMSGQAARENGDAYKLVARYYKQQRNDEIGDIQDRLKDEMKARGEETDRKTLQYLAYEQAWQRLQDGVQVSDDDLRELGVQRARRIKAILVEQHAVPPEQVFVLDANVDPATASLTTTLVLDAR